MVGGHGLVAQLHAGVLRRQVGADVLVQHEGDADLACGGERDERAGLRGGALWGRQGEMTSLLTNGTF